MERRVVITGLGAVCPIGFNTNQLSENLINGKAAVREITEDYEWIKYSKVRIASAFGKGNPYGDFNFDNEKIGIGIKDARRLSRFTQYGLEAAYQAVKDSGILDFKNVNDITGAVGGIGFGGIQVIEQEKADLIKRGLEIGISRVSPVFISKVISDALPGEISKLYGFHATEAKSVSTACASSASALVSGHQSIKLGDAKIMVCVGSEEPISHLPWSCFANMGAITSEFNDNPSIASRPFDRERSGFVYGEGAGCLILEELEHAKNRNAKIYGELLSYGVTCDASHLTQPSLSADYTTEAIIKALKNSRLNPEQIDYINTHGTSTPLNDPLETLAIKKALGEHAYKVSINSTKSIIGHTFGSSGALEAIVTLLTINSGVTHPTLNLEKKDLEPWTHRDLIKTDKLKPFDRRISCDLNYSNQASERKIKYALSNSFGFYGHNVVLAFGKY